MWLNDFGDVVEGFWRWVTIRIWEDLVKEIKWKRLKGSINFYLSLTGKKIELDYTKGIERIEPVIYKNVLKRIEPIISQ